MQSVNKLTGIFYQKANFQSFLNARKPKKVAIIDCARKMIVILNVLLRDGVMWYENIAKN